jgi:rare lipoprotein A
MPVRPTSIHRAAKIPLRIYLLAGVSSVVWVAGAVTVFFTTTVYADTQLTLARPLATLPPGPPPVTVTTPVSLEATSKPVKSKFLRGLATWYGAQFHGRKTASGEIFDMYALTACHPSLPFGTLVRVKNLRNRRSVVVRITDRNDLFHGRIIDLSFAAAEALNMTGAGVAPVTLEVLGQAKAGK